jgi:hypothetical protein
MCVYLFGSEELADLIELRPFYYLLVREGEKIQWRSTSSVKI